MVVLHPWSRSPGAGPRGDRPAGLDEPCDVRGLTHEPAARLAQLLVELTPAGLETVFFCDSGSVSVEVAIKMALQYWRSLGLPAKHRLMTWRGGYHGDTFAPMSVCDPEGGMHSLWTDVLVEQIFADRVPGAYDGEYMRRFEAELTEHAAELAAVIVEPMVQGAGGCDFTIRGISQSCAPSATGMVCC